MAPDLIAFYGTLMAGFGGQERLGVNHRLELVAPCVREGTLTEMRWYPGLAADPQQPRIASGDWRRYARDRGLVR